MKKKAKANNKPARPVARKPRKTYHHGDTRAALIGAATDLIYEHGASGFSLREAARVIGVDPTTCYRHFQDRNEILIAIAQQGFTILTNELKSVPAKNGSKRRILEQGTQYVFFAQKYPGHFRLMFGECGIPARDPRMRPPEMDYSAYDYLEESLSSWASRNGYALDVTHIALLLWASVHGLARLVLDGAVPLEPEAMRSVVKDLGSAVLNSASRKHTN